MGARKNLQRPSPKPGGCLEPGSMSPSKGLDRLPEGQPWHPLDGVADKLVSVELHAADRCKEKSLFDPLGMVRNPLDLPVSLACDLGDLNPFEQPHHFHLQHKPWMA